MGVVLLDGYGKVRTVQFAESATYTRCGVRDPGRAVFITNNNFFGAEGSADTTAFAPVPKDSLSVFLFGFLVAIVCFRSCRFNVPGVSH